MERWIGKIAIVTGASAGIGASIAEELAKAGVVVVGLARRKERLETLSASLIKANCKGKFYPRQCDVAKEDELLDAFKWVNAQFGGVDILINNAGVGRSVKIIDDDIDSFRRTLDVNVLAVAISIREAVASMKQRDVAGYIININSTSGHVLPNSFAPLSVYPSSKHAVTALTETVRRELAQEGNDKIRITSLSPGLVKTEIMKASGVSETEYGKYPHLDPKDIADTVLFLLGTRHKVHVTELTIRPVGETIA